MIESNPIAKAYLKTDGDDNNACLLFEKHLIIIFKSKKSHYPVEWIQQLSFKHKIYLIPIVFGGLGSALTALALFNYNFNPWVVLSLLFISLFTLYFGIQGGVALVVNTPIKEYDYFILESTQNMKAFVAFFNNYRNGYSISYYVYLTPEDLTEVFNKGFYQNHENGITLYLTPSSSKDLNSFKLTTKGFSFSIKYVQDSHNSLIPKVFDRIPKEAFLKSND